MSAGEGDTEAPPPPVSQPPLVEYELQREARILLRKEKERELRVSTLYV